VPSSDFTFPIIGAVSIVAPCRESSNAVKTGRPLTTHRDCVGRSALQRPFELLSVCLRVGSTTLTGTRRGCFEQGEIDIDPDDDKLAGQRGSITWGIDSRARVKIESKDDMRKRGLPLPDRAATAGDVVLRASC
jgi:hypothetical protein